MNTRNYGVLTGRLTRDPVSFTNKDGSKTVMLTLAVQNNFKNKDGVRGTNFIPVEAFVGAGKPGLGVYEFMHQGSLVSVSFDVRSSSYVKDDQTHYTTTLFVQDVDLLESKQTTDARQAKDKDEPVPAAPADIDDDEPFSE